MSCEADWRWDSRPETFEHHNLWIIHRGSGTMRLDAGPDVAVPVEVPLRRGQTFVLRPRTRCRARHDPADPLTVSYLHFHLLNNRGRRRRSDRADVGLAGLPPLHKRIGSVDLFEAIARRVALGEALPGGREEAEAYLSAMLIGLRAEPAIPASTDGVARAAVLDAAAFARERPGEVRTVADLADRAGYGVDHFSVLFAEHVGTSPGVYLLDARLARAQHLLTHGRLPMADVARAAGWRSSAFFSRQFTARLGVTPTVYRNG